MAVEGVEAAVVAAEGEADLLALAEADRYLHIPSPHSRTLVDVQYPDQAPGRLTEATMLEEQRYHILLEREVRRGVFCRSCYRSQH